MTVLGAVIFSLKPAVTYKEKCLETCITISTARVLSSRSDVMRSALMFPGFVLPSPVFDLKNTPTARLPLCLIQVSLYPPSPFWLTCPHIYQNFLTQEPIIDACLTSLSFKKRNLLIFFWLKINVKIREISSRLWAVEIFILVHCCFFFWNIVFESHFVWSEWCHILMISLLRKKKLAMM